MMKITFLRFEWPGCPSVEVSAEGNLTVDDEEATAEEFALALARIAQTWKDSFKPPDRATSVTALLLRGPLPYWTGDSNGKPGETVPSSPNPTEEQ